MREYGGFIWTNHALQRLKERGISQGDAWATLRNPEQSRYAKTQGAWVYYKTYGDQKIEVVAKQNEKKQWIVLSVWSRPIYGRHTHPQKRHGKSYKKDSLFIKLLKKIFRV